MLPTIHDLKYCDYIVPTCIKFPFKRLSSAHEGTPSAVSSSAFYLTKMRIQIQLTFDYYLNSQFLTIVCPSAIKRIKKNIPSLLNILYNVRNELDLCVTDVPVSLSDELCRVWMIRSVARGFIAFDSLVNVTAGKINSIYSVSLLFSL